MGELRTFYLEFSIFLQNSCRAENENLYMYQWDSLSLVLDCSTVGELKTFYLDFSIFYKTVVELSIKLSICIRGTLSLAWACTTVGESRIFHCDTDIFHNSCIAEWKVL